MIDLAWVHSMPVVCPVEMICATDQNYLLGTDGIIPWKCADDMKHFRTFTFGHICIMGRKTWESLPSHNLVGRELFILSRSEQPEDLQDNQFWFDSLKSLQKALLKRNDKRKIVIGGAQIYQQIADSPLFKLVALSYTQINLQAVRNTSSVYFNPKIMTSLRTIKIFHCNSKSPAYSIRQLALSETNLEEMQYHQICKDVMNNGQVVEPTAERTCTGTLSQFGKQMTFDLSSGKIPVLTTKRVYWKGVVAELLWFLSGSTDSDVLSKQKVRIWEANTTKEFLTARGLDYQVGDIGPGYSFQWRHAGADYKGKLADYTGQGTDQISNLISCIKTNPHSRRMLVDAWSVPDLPRMALPPCHMFFQAYVREDTLGKHLSLQMYQRSADLFLGVPFNISSYALLLLILCQLTGCKPDKLTMVFGDVHVYRTHLEQVKLQLQRTPLDFPTIDLPSFATLDELLKLSPADFKLQGYCCYPPIAGKMAV